MVNGTELREGNTIGIMESLDKACSQSEKKTLCDLVTKATVPRYLGECEGVLWVLKKK